MRWILLSLAFLAAPNALAGDAPSLLNASYDPTREFYADYNRDFAQQWEKETGEHLRIRMSHGGSGKQARAVMDGLQADIVTLALGADIDALAGRGLLRHDWRTALPGHAAPYRSTIVFLVRKGNPKKIHDWPDLARSGVRVLTPNPKTSGGARWNYLAAWAYASAHGTPQQARQFMQTWLKNVVIFDTGARAATTNFVRRKQGDVLITWENEAYVAQHYFGADAFEIVTPSVTMLCEPSIAVVDSVVDARGTRALAQRYAMGLYSDAAQRLIAKHHFRPLDTTLDTLPSLEGRTVRRVEQMGGWSALQRDHFAQGGLFDQLTAPQ